MRAVRVQEFGGPEVLRVDEVATPSPGPDEVRIRVQAAGLNYTDLLQREGRLPGAPPPFIPGVEVAGVVDAVGSAVGGLTPGARVVAVLPGQGAFAEYAVAPANAVTTIPDGLRFEQAVALPVQATAALLALRLGAALRPGQSVFVPSAGGGVGSFLLQFARRLGASRVVAGASHEAKRALARRLGAAVTIDSTREDWPERVREATDGRGVDIVLVMGGGETVAQSLRAVAPGGRLVLLGVESMLDTQLSRAEVGNLVAQNQALVGFASFTLPAEVTRSALREVVALAESGAIEAVVGQIFGLDEVAAAHRAMASRSTLGKLVVRVGEP